MTNPILETYNSVGIEGLRTALKSEYSREDVAAALESGLKTDDVPLVAELLPLDKYTYIPRCFEHAGLDKNSGAVSLNVVAYLMEQPSFSEFVHSFDNYHEPRAGVIYQACLSETDKSAAISAVLKKTLEMPQTSGGQRSRMLEEGFIALMMTAKGNIENFKAVCSVVAVENPALLSAALFVSSYQTIGDASKTEDFSAKTDFVCQQIDNPAVFATAVNHIAKSCRYIPDVLLERVSPETLDKALIASTGEHADRDSKGANLARLLGFYTPSDEAIIAATAQALRKESPHKDQVLVLLNFMDGRPGLINQDTADKTKLLIIAAK